ncbi:MAG: 16S rRNA (cytosine967-C5)-methyltransferase [Desulforhopalus sp.]|jgi:16S rRNA (cytosine967-C5)-methyltransferase
MILLPFSSTPSGLHILQNQKSRSARYCAAKILSSITKSQAPVKPVFDRVVQQYNLPSNERNLTMQLAYGVLRKRQFLDRALTILSRTPIRKMDLFVHQALAVGLYQIFFLSRIPASAAVNEAVESCKVAKIHKRLHGFVNGILRQAIRTKEDLVLQIKTDSKGREILNHPEWLTRRWQKNFGKEATTALCRNNNEEPILCLRVNTTRTSQTEFLDLLAQENIEAHPGLYAEDAIILPDFSGSITALPGYDQGFFQIQDQAAQLATTLLAPFVSKGTYLDGCAGLGGKTSHILQETADIAAHVHAVDPEPFRLQKLQENIDRLFSSPPLTIHHSSLLDITVTTVPAFDGILIDAPCSGTGVIGRHPDIRWNRTEDDLEHYHNEQMALLSHAATLLKEGGLLVYATCSLEPEENNTVIRLFLENHTDFELTDCKNILHEKNHRFVHNGFFHPLPEATIDGFFAARLMKKSKA